MALAETIAAGTSSLGRELKYNADQRREYLLMIDRVGGQWLDVFQGNTDFYSAIYWDLLTQLWRRPGPVRKTDALKYMTAIKSAHTAGKYLQETIDQGLVVEMDNPEDDESRPCKGTTAMHRSHHPGRAGGLPAGRCR